MNRTGFTLVELLVTLALIAILFAVAPLAKGLDAPNTSGWRAELASARRRAIREGLVVSSRADSIGRYSVQPDGSLVTDSLPVSPQPVKR